MRIEEFEPQKEYLVCIDSDGCAMDTMNIKHFRCFGPCMISEWELEEWGGKLLNRWNEINLYTKTRGTNRFKTLKMQLEEVNDSYREILGIEDLRVWIENTKELSNKSLQEEIQRTHSEMLKKVLHWSEKVNECIGELRGEEKKSFRGVKDALKVLKAKADLVVVSSANREAVEEEWGREGLLPYVDLVMTQNDGSKAFCIQKLLEKGYCKDNILMIGDAPGDLEAAYSNQVGFFPILVRKEIESWRFLKEKVAFAFFEGGYRKDMEDSQIQIFKQSLGI